MNKEKNRKSTVRISLIDVMYGVVLAYGFGFFDQADTVIDYLHFFFAYAVIIIDWIYVHSLYWGWEYKYNSFFLLLYFDTFLPTSKSEPRKNGQNRRKSANPKRQCSAT